MRSTKGNAELSHVGLVPNATGNLHRMNRRFLGSLLLVSTLIGGGLTSGVSAATAGQQRSTYIVVFKDGANAQAEAGNLRGQGFGVRNVYENLFPGVAVELPATAARNIARNPNVSFVEKDFVMTKVSTQAGATWGLDRSDQRNRPLDGNFSYPDSGGTGVKVFIVDTGVNASHNEFTGRMASGYTAVTDGLGTDDCDGHGTHVAGSTAGTTYGIAKKATIVPVRVLDCTGSGYVSWIAAGLDWIAANRGSAPSVANMSLGGGASAMIDNAVSRLHNSGVTVVVAAGNSNANACNYSPARVGVAVTVGATTISDSRASYSNFGSCLDIFAPGSSITSAWIGSTTATGTISGTSMASPHVAGAAALLLGENSSLTPTQVRDALVNSATAGVVTSAGTNSPNRLLYVNNSSGSTSPTTTLAPTTSLAPTTTLAPVATPGAFTKSTPVSGATNVSRKPTFSWTASANAVSYQICVSPTVSCSSWTNAGSSSSFFWSSTLKSRTTYYWQVRAVNAAGTTIASEGSWRFTTAR